MNDKSGKIGIFDSGIGGTTVLRELIKALPNEDYIYYGDNGNFPYGSGKTKEDLQKLCERILKFFLMNNCKLVVVACNTASIAAIEYLRENFSLPIIGIIESGVKGAIKNTINKNVAVISTKFTAEAHGYKKQADNLDSDLNITEIACKEFPNMIEKGWETFSNSEELLNKYLSKIPENADTLVLGCTHYPLIRDVIEQHTNIKIVDPAFQAVEEVKRTLKSLNILNTKSEKGKLIFFVTGESKYFQAIVEKILDREIDIYRIPNKKLN